MNSCQYCNKDLNLLKTDKVKKAHVRNCKFRPVHTITKGIKCTCVVCKKELPTCNFDTHYESQHSKNCKQCNKILKTSGSEFCSKSCSGTYNNGQKDYTKIKTGPAKGIRSFSPIIKCQCGSLLPSGYLTCVKCKTTTKPKKSLSRVLTPQYCEVSFCVICNGVIANKIRRTCSDPCKSKSLSVAAKKTVAKGKLGGNKNNRAYGWYESSIAGKVWLDSTWEASLAKELDTLGIIWGRPPSIDYVLNGKSKKYFPDFYLKDYDVYLDPKNPYLQIKDAEKFKAVSEQNNVRLIMLSKDQLTWEKIKELL